MSSPPLALITGSAKRLGAYLAIALAQSGWDIVIHYHRSKSDSLAIAHSIRELGQQAWTLEANLESADETIDLMKRCIDGIRLPNLLINNASFFGFDNPHTALSSDMARHYQINTIAPILLTQHYYKAIKAYGNPMNALTINILDQKLFNLNPDFLSYTLSKTALHTATELLAKSFAPILRIVGIAPGLTLPSHQQTQQSFEWAHQQTPLGRSSTPHDIAQTVLFLTQAESITGTTLVVDGGQHLLPLSHDIIFSTQTNQI